MSEQSNVDSQNPEKTCEVPREVIERIDRETNSR